MLKYDPEVDYMDYVQALGENETAWKVKTTDLRHSYDLMRLKGVTNIMLEEQARQTACCRPFYSGLTPCTAFRWPDTDTSDDTTLMAESEES